MIVLYIIVSVALLVAVAFIINKLTVAEGFDGNLPQQITHNFNPIAVVSATNDVASNELLSAATDSVRIESHSSTTKTLTPSVPSFLAFPAEPNDIAAAKICEAIKQTDVDSCDLLTNAAKQQCGFCLKDGITHDGQPIRGGLYISKADKTSIEALATARGEKPIYKPTILGSATCAPGYFFVNADICKDGAHQLSCAVGGSVSTNGTCGQCVDYPDKFVYVGPQPIKFATILRIIGDGILNVSINGKLNVQTQQLIWSEELSVTLPLLAEGDIITISITKSVKKAVIGQLDNLGPETRGISLDTIIGKSVRRLGTLKSFNVSTTLIKSSAFWMWAGDSDSFVASGPIPATIRNPVYPIDEARCPTGALIMTPAGQQIYNTDPCRGEIPTATCARFLWTSGGCTPDGTGYQMAQSLGSDKGAIAAAVADLVTVQQTGKHSDGRQATRKEIVIATKQCSGQTLSTCDGPFKNTGPHDPECLKEIYENPATYSADYPPCNASGTLNPANKDSDMNRIIMGVDDLRARLRSTQISAATSTNPAQQSDSMKHCYGLKIHGNEQQTCPIVKTLFKVGRRMSIGHVTGEVTKYVRHAGYRFWADLNDNSELMRNDGTFIIRPALWTGASTGSVSFESVNFPGFFIVSPGEQSTLSQARPGSDNTAKSATYIIKLNSDGTFTMSTNGKYFARLPDGRSVGLANIPTSWTIKPALL